MNDPTTNMINVRAELTNNGAHILSDVHIPEQADIQLPIRCIDRTLTPAQGRAIRDRTKAVSPPWYRWQIRRRNRALLHKLMLLEPYVDGPMDAIPDSLMSYVIKTTPIGCPHCGRGKARNHCRACDWNAGNTEFQAGMLCITVPFMGVAYDCNHRIRYAPLNVSIAYSATAAYIDFDYTGDCLTLASWQRALLFVLGHIEWTYEPGWGSRWLQDRCRRFFDWVKATMKRKEST